jgi:hypothetical protein
MKRMHVHVSVEDLVSSVRFYSTLFAAEPTVLESDYAKWMLDDPRVNFAISQRGGPRGVRHLGIQVEDRTELAEVDRRPAGSSMGSLPYDRREHRPAQRQVRLSCGARLPAPSSVTRR